MDFFFPMFLFCLLLQMSEPGPACDDILVTEFSQNDCIKKTSYESYFYAVDTDAEICIPYCEKYNINGYSRKPCPCVPGYVCSLRCYDDIHQVCTTNADCKNFPNICMKTCVADDRTCMAYYANTTDYDKTVFTAQKFKPSCQNDGLWKAKQCKGGISGRCMCFDSFGTRLFGEAKYGDSKDMTCACSRRKSDLLNSGRPYVSFHCNSVGNYEELQCDSGLCWCVEETTGEPTSPLVPVKAMTKLPCYQVSKTGSQYLRQCDSVTYATAEI